MTYSMTYSHHDHMRRTLGNNVANELSSRRDPGIYSGFHSSPCRNDAVMHMVRKQQQVWLTLWQEA
jgi:hypothetical protein